MNFTSIYRLGSVAGGSAERCRTGAVVGGRRRGCCAKGRNGGGWGWARRGGAGLAGLPEVVEVAVEDTRGAGVEAEEGGAVGGIDHLSKIVEEAGEEGVAGLGDEGGDGGGRFNGGAMCSRLHLCGRLHGGLGRGLRIGGWGHGRFCGGDGVIRKRLCSRLHRCSGLHGWLSINMCSGLHLGCADGGEELVAVLDAAVGGEALEEAGAFELGEGEPDGTAGEAGGGGEGVRGGGNDAGGGGVGEEGEVELGGDGREIGEEGEEVRGEGGHGGPP